MKKNIGMRIFSLLLVISLVSMMTLPVMASESGTSCSAVEQKAGQTNLSGLEKYEAVVSALNKNDVRNLSVMPGSEDLSMIVNNAEAFTLEKKLEDGSVKKITAVVLPVESVIEKDGSVQISNVVAVWDSNKTRVLKYTSTYQNKSLYRLTFSRIGNDKNVIEAVIVNNGTLVDGMPGQFFVAEDDDYWGCVAGCIIGDCICAIAGVPCPPGIPICDACVAVLSPCYYIPSPYTCAPAAICMGVELAWCMSTCL